MATTGTANQHARSLQRVLPLLLVTIVVAFGCVRLGIAATTTISSSNDSGDYRHSAATPTARIDLSSTAPPRGRVRTPGPIIDVFGNGLRPGFLVQSVYAAMPNDRSRVVFQCTLAAVAWGVLALTLATMVRRPWAKALIVAATMLASLSPIVTWWDVSIAQESVMLSASLVFLGALVSYVWPHVGFCGTRLGSRAVLAILITSTAVAAFCRPQTAALLVPLALVGMLVRRLGRAPAGPSARQIMAAGAAMVVVCLWAGVSLANNFPRWKEEEAVGRFADRMSDRGYLALARRLGMPRCAALDKVIRDNQRHVLVDYVAPLIDAAQQCPRLRRWFEDGGVAPQDVLLHDPGLFAREYFGALDHVADHPEIRTTKLGGTFQFVANGKVVTVRIPELPNPLPRVQEVLWAPAGLSPWLAVVLAAAGLGIGIRRRAARDTAPAIALLGATIVVSMAYYAIVWSLAGAEHARHALPLQLVVTAVVWAVVLGGTGTPTPWRHETRWYRVSPPGL